MNSDRRFRTPPAGWVRDQLELIDQTGDTRSVNMQGMSVVVFEIEGAKSGLWRRIPLMRVAHDGCYAAVASNGGAPRHPAWYHSILAHPEVTIQDGTDYHQLRARELSGAEREQWWQRCVTAFPNYADYQANTKREIPVFVCEPRS
ncbi:MAG: nitroreductase family deazaflavin-dependent oxidoreductase [Beutenbergiaceae bacterium]